MNVKTLTDVVSRRPFRPFTIRMANGARIRVGDPDRVAVHPKGSVVILFENDGGTRILDMPLIAELRTN